MSDRHRAPGWLRRVARALRSAPWLVALAALGIALAALLVVFGALDRDQAQQATETAQQAQTDLDKVADPLAALCAADPTVRARVGDACNTAQQVVERPPDPAATTEPPQDGRGVVATVIRPDDGHLVVSYTDGSRIDVGPVVGRTGDPGRGVTFSTINNGRLILTFSDGTTQDLGPVVGERGRGIETTQIVDGRLIVTYDDGTTDDAGPLPQGPAGKDGTNGTDGAPGPACPEGYRPEQTGEAVGADGTVYARSVTCVDPSSASPPASTEPPIEEGG